MQIEIKTVEALQKAGIIDTEGNVLAPFELNKATSKTLAIAIVNHAKTKTTVNLVELTPDYDLLHDVKKVGFYGVGNTSWGVLCLLAIHDGRKHWRLNPVPQNLKESSERMQQNFKLLRDCDTGRHLDFYTYDADGNCTHTILFFPTYWYDRRTK